MDGSFAIALLLAMAMSFANAGITGFGAAFWVTKGLSTGARILISSCAAMVLVATVYFLCRSEMEVFEEQMAMGSQFGTSSSPAAIGQILFIANSLGLLTLLGITFALLRTRTSGFKLALKWIAIPAVVLHVGLTVLAMFVIRSFS